MSDIEDYIRVLESWNSQPMKTVSDVLLRIQQLSVVESEQDLEKVIDALMSFKKEANNHDQQQEVNEQWFSEIVKAKNHASFLIQQQKKNKGPKFIKKQSKIECPDQLLEQKSELYKSIMKSFYKHFVINMNEQILQDNQTVVNYLDRIIKCLFEQFGFSNEKANVSQEKTNKLFDRVQKIYKALGRTSSTLAKKEMMIDKIDPKLVATMDPKGFQSQEGERIKRNKMQRLFKQNSTGFYQQLKKRINMDAKQQCKFCHKQAAYCEGQKQIRASDEPMTKFMRCNSCDRQWRQE